MQSTTIDSLAEIICDEKAYPASNGYRDPASPSFIFFDDDRSKTRLELWSRETALDIEEYIARKEHDEALDKRLETIQRQITRELVIEEEFPPLKPAKPGRHKLAVATKQQIEWAARASSYMTRRPTRRVIKTTELTDTGFVPKEDFPKVFTVVEYINAEYDDQRGIERRIKSARQVDYYEAQELARSGNWLVGFYKRQPQNNDHWRKLVAPMVRHMEDHPFLSTVVGTITQSLPFAPGPIRGTIFVNPDGTKVETEGTSPMNAKVAYAKKHNLDGQFVTMDRVQKEGERFSRWVIGTRRTSDQTPSNYYDPYPKLTEKLVNGEWTQVYDPTDAVLFKVRASGVMPPDSHRLTIREFEQAVISGCDIQDDDELDQAEQFTVRELEAPASPDPRIMVLDMGYGRDGRDQTVFTHQEEYLMAVLRRFGMELAAELMSSGNQEPGLLHNFFYSGAKTKTGDMIPETVKDIIRYVKEDPEAEEGYLEYVAEALMQAPQEEIAGDKALSKQRLAALATPHVNDYFTVDTSVLDIPGVTKPAYHSWK